MSARLNRKLMEVDARINGSPPNSNNFCRKNHHHDDHDHHSDSNTSTGSGQNSEGNSPTLTENRPTATATASRRIPANSININANRGPNGNIGRPNCGSSSGRTNGSDGNSGNIGIGTSNTIPIMSPRERLESFAGSDFDMLKPLLMYNIENIQSFRADCKYSSKRLRQINKSRRR